LCYVVFTSTDDVRKLKIYKGGDEVEMRGACMGQCTPAHTLALCSDRPRFTDDLRHRSQEGRRTEGRWCVCE